MFQSAESRYNAWVREHYRFLLRAAWALTGSRATAEDVVQDCFASAWKNREQLREASLARAWLFQIMRRSAWRYLAPGLVSLDDVTLPEAAAPDAALDERLDVVRALARLAPIHREVLVLYYFDDMPTAQMAEALEVAPGTVLSRLSRAREALKVALDPPAQDPLQSSTKVAPLSRLRKVP
ncbi:MULTISPECIES: RNA polymerase sigma factor [Ramlibacter]|uniref:RNA polymerase sigma factor n=1 Tax=Ramlibacter aquaticus TaxID=2780094 RepID=A0ABR9SH44_9BURK|nr:MULTISPECIES: RNA polymerase sigma factor [Ramlibacter]MBE7941682.1 RNA polymerase sigma factor [Ramlibacter aquaticus]